MSYLALAVLAERAGIPPGVFSVLTGSSREIGGELTANPEVRKLTFTGSTEVGRTLMKQSADTIKKLSLMQKKFITTDPAQQQALQKEIDAADKKAKELYEKRKSDAAQAG